MTHDFMQKCSRSIVVLSLICFCIGASAAPKRPSPFSDVPSGDPAYKALKELRKAGIVGYTSVCFPSSRGAAYDRDHLHLTRYEFAVATQRAVATLKHRQGLSAAKPTAHQLVLRRMTERLAAEFKWEIAQLERPTSVSKQ
jgi:hypothetical protein